MFLSKFSPKFAWKKIGAAGTVSFFIATANQSVKMSKLIHIYFSLQVDFSVRTLESHMSVTLQETEYLMISLKHQINTIIF